MSLTPMTPDEPKDFLSAAMENYVDYSDQSKIPPRMLIQINQYIDKGTPLCSFLEAVFSNDLFDCYGRADVFNAPLVPYYVNYVYNYCPRGCHGSREIVKQWSEKKRNA